MKSIFEDFSTRQMALLIWILLALAAILINKKSRTNFYEIFKSLCTNCILVMLMLLTGYVTTFIFFLHKYHLWDISLLKHTLIWFFTVAIVFSLTSNKAKDRAYFKRILIESFRFGFVLDFFMNFFTFGLLTEIILMPLIFILFVLQAVSETNTKSKSAHQFLTNLIAFAGLFFFFIVIYKTIIGYQMLFTMHNLFALLLPPVFTLLLIPFLYLLALYISYEELFIDIRFMMNDTFKKRAVRQQILRVANVNLNKLNTISRKMKKVDFYHHNDLNAYFKGLIKPTTLSV